MVALFDYPTQELVSLAYKHGASACLDSFFDPKVLASLLEALVDEASFARGRVDG